MEKGRRIQYLAAFSLSLAAVTIGGTSSWPIPVLPKLANNETKINTITDDQIATILAMSAPGFMSGSLATRFISDNLGRRTTVLASALPIACGMSIAVFANLAWMLYIMKFLWGFGVGMVATVVNIYLTEIADKDLRGTLAVGTMFMFHFGSLIMISVGPFVSYNTINYSISVMPVCYFVACLWIPESPYYHLKKGRPEHARQVLLKLKNKDNVERELDMMKEDVTKEMRRSSSAWELFSGKQYRRPLVIAAGLKIAKVMCGSLTIPNYLGRIMQEANKDIKLSTLLIIFGAVKFIVGIMATPLVDRIGRRKLLVFSFIGTGVSCGIVGTYFFLQEIISVDHDLLKVYGYVPFAAIIVSDVVSTLGFEPIVEIVQAEIFPLNVKVVAMTLLNILGGCLFFFVTKGYQEIKNVSGLCGVFWIFSIVGILGAIFSYFIVPETRGKSLREIQKILQFDVDEQKEEDAESKKLNDVSVIQEFEKDIRKV